MSRILLVDVLAELVGECLWVNLAQFLRETLKKQAVQMVDEGLQLAAIGKALGLHLRLG